MMTQKGTRTLETGRLILRRAIPEDAIPMFHNWASEPEETVQPRVNAAEPEIQLGDPGIFRENMLLPAGIVLIFLGLLAVWKGSREEK